MNSSGKQLAYYPGENTGGRISQDSLEHKHRQSVMIQSVGDFVELIKLTISICSGAVPLLAVTGRSVRSVLDKILRVDLPLKFEVLTLSQNSHHDGRIVEELPTEPEKFC